MHTLGIGNSFSWLLGIVVMAIGLINTFWGNDPGYGIFIFFLSFAYFPLANVNFKRLIDYSILVIIKIILVVSILYTAFGLAELLDKIDLMVKDLQ